MSRIDRPESTTLPRRLGTTRARLAWWVIVVALGGFVLFVLYTFVGTFTLGVFLYYAARPAFERVRRVIVQAARIVLVDLVDGDRLPSGGPAAEPLASDPDDATPDDVPSSDTDAGAAAEEEATAEAADPSGQTSAEHPGS